MVICEVCSLNNSKYKCPCCSKNTCSLQCSVGHKKKWNCSGIKTFKSFSSTKEMNDKTLYEDYCFLENALKIKDRANIKIAKFYQHKNSNPKKLKFQSLKIGLNLIFLSEGMSLRNENSSFYSQKNNMFCWKISLKFQLCDKNLFISKRLFGNSNLKTIIVDVLNERSVEFDEKWVIFLKSFQLNKYYSICFDQSIDESLKNKTIIEYPQFFIADPIYINNYSIII